MRSINKFFYLFIILFLLYSSFAFSASARKPLPPLRVSITPTQTDITSTSIKPGEKVELTVTAVSAQDVREMQIDVQLLRGAKLVSGSTTWRGSASRNEQKTINLIVQAPEKGKGTVRARVSLPPSNGTRFSAETEFTLGPDRKTGPEPKRSLQKDGTGRNIIEYR